MNFLEAYEKYKRGKIVERPALNGNDKIAFPASVKELTTIDIETTNWYIKEKPMNFSKAMKHFLTGKTVSTKEYPQYKYILKSKGFAVTFLNEEIASKNWFIVEEEPQQNDRSQ